MEQAAEARQWREQARQHLAVHAEDFLWRRWTGWMSCQGLRGEAEAVFNGTKP